jgi:hypothetical protein
MPFCEITDMRLLIFMKSSQSTGLLEITAFEELILEG